MKAIKITLFFIFLFFSTLLISSCSKNKKIKIAIMTKLESGSMVGSSEINIAKMFIEDKNIDNIEIVPIDDGWNPQKSLEAIQEVQKQGIDILITSHVSTCALAIMDSINKYGIITIMAGSTTDKLSNKDDYIFRNIPDVHEEQKSIANYINTNNWSNLLIILDTLNKGYGEPALKYFLQYASQKEIPIIKISIDNYNLDDLEQNLLKTNFENLYLLVGGYKSSCGSIAQLASKLKPNVKILYTPWMLTPLLLESAGSSINQSIIPSHYPMKGSAKEIDVFLSKFNQKFKYYPTMISLNVYKALEIMNDALQNGAKDANSIKKYLLNKKTFKTELGVVEFDRFGDAKGSFYFINEISKEFQ